MAPDDWRDLGPDDGPAPGQLRLVRDGDLRLCLGRTEDGHLFALDDLCPHGRLPR